MNLRQKECAFPVTFDVLGCSINVHFVQHMRCILDNAAGLWHEDAEDINALKLRLNSSGDYVFGVTFPDGSCGISPTTVYLRTDASAGAIAHESWHAVNHMLRDKGIPLENETLAYHLGYLVDQIEKQRYSSKVEEAVCAY